MITCLVVDDSAMIRAMVARAIRLSGAGVDQILEAANGLEALTLLACSKVDFVLSDVHMPEMGGAELIARMREGRFAAIPIAIISAEPSLERIEQLCRQGARGFLRKPFTPENVRSLIVQLLEAPK